VTATPTLHQRLLRYAVVGGLVMGVFTALNWLFGHWLGKDLSFVLAYPPAVTLHFWLNKKWTFGCVRTDARRQVTEYAVMVLVTFAIQAAVFKVLTSTTSLPGWAAAGAANAAQMVITFFAMQYRIFGRASARETEGAPPPEAAQPERTGLFALLAVSYGLRLIMAFGGGQAFWPDEARYESARRAAFALGHSQWKTALVELFGHADHVLFRLVSLPPAMVEYAMGGTHLVLLSAYFSLFSVGVIFLVWAVARRAGASAREAMWAAFLAAASTSLLYYSRHFLPYDSAMFVLMVGLWLALGSYSAANSALVGCVVALGCLTYNGYWLMGASVLALHAAFGSGGAGRSVRRVAFSGIGFLLTVAAVVGLGQAVSGHLIAEYQAFSGSVKQGDFYVGYKVIAGYLWYAERGPLVVFMAALAYALGAAGKDHDFRRLKWWLSGIVIILGGLVLFSDVIPRFMVYGRLTRQVIPFVCLGAGMGISRFVGQRGSRERLYSGAVFLLVVGLAAFNFWVPLRQVFPDGFRAEAKKVIAAHQGKDLGFYRILFAESLWADRLDIELPPHTELLRRANPLQFRPYQFEGFSVSQRDEINHHDVAMQLMTIPFERAGPGWEGYPGPVHVRVLFHPDYWGESEPLIESGESGAGDVILATFDDPDHISFAQDHWGAGSTLSEAIRIDYSKPHDLVISEGPLVPPHGSAIYATSPELEGLCDQMVLLLDGKLVLSKRAKFFPTGGAFYWASNAIGASTVVANFRGSVYEFGSAPLEQVAAGIPTMAAVRIGHNRPPEWNGAVGPVRLRFVMPGQLTAEPLMSLNGKGSKDVIFVTRAGPGLLRLGIDRAGAGAIMSGPLKMSASGIQEMDISVGSLLPDTGAAIYEKYPGLARFRGMVYARLNSEPALLATMPFSPLSGAFVTLGANTIGSSTYPDNFDGKIVSFDPIGPENIPTLGSRLSDLLDNPDETWDGFTGPIRIRAVFPTGRAGQRDPLLSSGTKGKADTFFVQYDSDTQVRFGYVHTGDPAVVSIPVTVEPGAPQDILISSGAVMPPEKSDVYLKTPDVDPLRTFNHVGINGRPIVHEYLEPYPSTMSQVAIGLNPQEALSVGPRFQGTIEAITTTRPLDALEEGKIDRSLGREGWNGYPGPLEIRMVVPAGTVGDAQPIVTTGLRGIGDVIFLRYEADGMAVVGQDHWGSKLLLSEPFPLATGMEHTLVVSLGALYPPADAKIAQGSVVPEELRGRTIILVDGRKVLNAEEPSHPSQPERIMVGAALIGATTSHSIFSGQVTGVRQAPLGAVEP
jgi:putative flippase GtrA